VTVEVPVAAVGDAGFAVVVAGPGAGAVVWGVVGVGVGVVFCVAWAMPEAGIESNIRISGEQNRFI
jgi:cbb3-type cytochrome oxidase subunit 1